MPNSPTLNRNLRRRAGPGFLAGLIAPVLKPLLRVLRRESEENAPWTVFESYMVGDFFMALPALNLLKKSAAGGSGSDALRVVCRPDCVELLAREGMTGIPFANDFRVRPGLASFLRTWRAAWALRGRLGPVALDFDADPRTAFWLKVAGVPRAVSYRRSFGILFDETFLLPENSVHQADRDLRVAEEFVKVGGRRSAIGGREPTEPIEVEDSDTSNTRVNAPEFQDAAARPPTADRQPTRWILSVWTRKASKNWPLDRWEAVMEKLSAAGVPFAVLEAPDGDAVFRGFRERWSGRADFLRGTLTEIADAVRASAGVIATDNFLGHMAGYYGKPVLWINRCSPADQVEPRGPRTRAVEASGPEGAAVEEVWRVFEALRAP